MKAPCLLVAIALGIPCGSAFAAPTELRFAPWAPDFEAAAGEYRAIWKKEGPRIIEALRRYSGVDIPDDRIRVIVFEGVSNSGHRGGPLRLRASYPEPVKRATVVHELLHRYLDEIDGLAACYPEVHDVMAVILFELWSELWGREFAMEQARVESARSRRYADSWSKALASSQSERRREIDGIASCRPAARVGAESGA